MLVKRYTSVFELYILHKIISLFTRQETEKYVIFNYIHWYLPNRWEWLKNKLNFNENFRYSLIIEMRTIVLVDVKSTVVYVVFPIYASATHISLFVLTNFTFEFDMSQFAILTYNCNKAVRLSSKLTNF